MKSDIILNIVDDQLNEEGIGQVISLGILTSLLSSAGLVEGATFQKNIQSLGKENPNKTLTISKQDLNKIVKDSQPEIKMIGEWTQEQALNVIARTLWMEARGEGDKGLNMVMTVIWNRADGNASKMVDECLRPKQFSCWNKIQSKTPKSYSIQFPKEAVGGSQLDIWNACQKLARNALNGTFTPINSMWNAYYNPNAVSKIPSWDASMKSTQMVGHHKVGYLREYDGARKHKSSIASNQNNTYVVKSGDTLWGIAKTHKITVDKLKSLNGLKSNNIQLGQVLKIA